MSAGRQWVRSRAKQHWHVAFHKVAARNLHRKYELVKVTPGVSEADRLHVHWRLGYHLFYSNQFFDAIGILESVCRNGRSEEEVQAMLGKRVSSSVATATAGARPGSLLAEIASEQEAEAEEEEDIIHGNYHVHMMAGRCSVKLFLQTSSHYHLENAYRHYQNCIENMSVPDDWQKKSMLRLPVALHEMGHLFEHYGAFPSAIELYTRIMTDYPHYRRYFDVMYRAALVGRHVSESLSKPDDVDATLNKCIDMLQFLLEALPASIDDSHIILLYGRTLDKHRDAAIRFRAMGVYKNLYEHLRDAKRCNADRCSSYKEWSDTPTNWFELGTDISAAGEPLLAKDAFEMFVLKLESKRQPGKDLSAYMDVETAMKVAHNLASFQNYSEAARFAEVALTNNRLHKEVRSCLTKWSKIHAVKLNKEASAINTMHDHWRTRVWSQTYRNKLKNHMLEEFENALENNRYDVAAREGLAYFARDKWRSRFMFETQCATRLQRFMRGRFKIWKAQTRLRTRYLNRAVEAYRKYNRTPFDYALREEIKAITKSKHCPRKHIINRVIAAIRGQDAAVLVMQRNYAVYRGRLAIFEGIRRAKQRKANTLFRCARAIQCMLRKRVARRRLALQRRWLSRRNLAASIIQRFVKWRNTTFQHAVTRVVRKRNARHHEARAVFLYIFSYYARRYIKRKRDELQKKKREELERLELERKFARINFLHRCSRILARFFRSHVVGSRQVVVASARLAARRSSVAAYSQLAVATFNKSFIVRPDNTVKEYEAIAEDPAARYEPPGVSQSSRQFLRALEQTSLYCHGDVSAADVMMISTVLRHPSCRLQRLVFCDVCDAQNAAFEFDLLPAIGRCRTLRALQLIGGAFSFGFLEGVIRDVQTENPRIKEILLERVVPVSMGAGRGAHARSLCDTAARLALDYFNYSVPGLSTLSLHGCTLCDEDVSLLCEGMAVNTSVRSLALSHNAITDVGVLALLEAWGRNKKGCLTLLDLRHNLIFCGNSVRRWLDVYNNHHVSLTSRRGAGSGSGSGSGDPPPPLDVLLAWNMLQRPYPDSEDPNATKGHRVLVHTNDVRPVTAADVRAGAVPLGSSFLPSSGGGPLFRKRIHRKKPATDVTLSPKKFLAVLTTNYKF